MSGAPGRLGPESGDHPSWLAQSQTGAQVQLEPHWQLGPQVQFSLEHGPGAGAAVVVWEVCWSFIGFVL